MNLLYRTELLLRSKIVQRQLATVLPLRGKSLVVARAFVAVFRLKFLVNGDCITQRLSLLKWRVMQETQKILAIRAKTS